MTTDGPEPALDVVTSSSDEPGAGERLRKALLRSGGIAWAKRHRLLLGGLTGLLVVVAVGTGYLVTRPPAPDPVVDITVFGFASGGSSGVDLQGHLRGTRGYQVTTRVAGDVDSMLGVVGPGLTDPTSSISQVTFGLPGVGTLGATVDCSDSHWWDARDADYRARVRRTDTHGRVTTYDAPLGEEPLGRSDAFWHRQVRRVCLDSFFRTLAPAGVSASVVRRGRQVDATLTLANPSRHALRVSTADFPDDVVKLTGGPWTVLPAEGTASVTVSIRADCAAGTPHVPFARSQSGETGNDRALPVRVYDTASPVEEQTVNSWARLDPASAVRLDSELGALCSPARP
jgi:hypothetical protein